MYFEHQVRGVTISRDDQPQLRKLRPLLKFLLNYRLADK
jgi:hypothetical protein